MPSYAQVRNEPQWQLQMSDLRSEALIAAGTVTSFDLLKNPNICLKREIKIDRYRFISSDLFSSLQGSPSNQQCDIVGQFIRVKRKEMLPRLMYNISPLIEAVKGFSLENRPLSFTLSINFH